MKCYRCGKAELVEGKGNVEYVQANLPYPVILVGVPVKRCPACAEIAVTIPDPNGLHHSLSRHIVTVGRPLYPQEVRFLRKYLDWNAGHLGAVMGVDPKTLSRWENGRQKMGTVAERFLRLLVMQRLAEDARDSAEQVLRNLSSNADRDSATVRVRLSGSGWLEAA